MSRFVQLPDEWSDEECRKVVDVWQKNLVKEKLYIVVGDFIIQSEPVRTEQPNKNEKVDHPSHYGGADNPYEAIKVIEAWNLGFCLGNTVKYISRAGKKDSEEFITDLKKAAWYLNRAIEQLTFETAAVK